MNQPANSSAGGASPKRIPGNSGGRSCGKSHNRGSSRTGFIILLALMSALHAFSIDAMLPALGEMGKDLALTSDNQRQLIITSLFLGFSVGVLAYGFLADRYGRRRPVIAGFLIFCVASVICTLSQNMETLLFGRVLQGVGAAGPYVIGVAIVKDRYDGRDMAEIMSLIMMVFIGVPMIAPFIGQYLQHLAGWRSIFVVLTVYAVAVLAWFYWRLSETLPPQKRRPLSGTAISSTIVEVVSEQTTLCYLIVLGVISGAFIVYLSTAQQVFHDMYALGDKLPLTIASLAISYGVACFVNSRMVQRVGMRHLVALSLLLIVVSSVAFSALVLMLGKNPELFVYLIYLAIVIFCFGFLFENVVTLALDPMSHIAGAAMSVITSVSTLMGVGISFVIGLFLKESVLPISIGFALMCACGLFLHWKLSAAENVATSSTL